MENKNTLENMENQEPNIEIIEDNNVVMTPAERFYRNHLKNVSNYQKRNPEKMRQKNRTHAKKVKEEQPEKYKEMLEQKKFYYLTVIKPRREQQMTN